MVGSIAGDPPPANPTGDFDGLPIPPLDPTYFSQHLTAPDQGNLNGCSIDDDFMLDDFDFDLSFDDIFPNNLSDVDSLRNPNFLPGFSESDSGQIDPSCFGQHESQLIGNYHDSSGGSNPVQIDPNCFIHPGSLLIAEDMPSLELHKDSSNSDVLNATSQSLHPVSGDVSGDISGYLRVPSPESNGSNHDGSQKSENDSKGSSDARVLNCHSPESQGSGNCRSNVSEGLNYPSDSNKSVHSSPAHSSPTYGYNSIKLEGFNANSASKSSSLLKRKKGSEDLNNASKYQKSIIVARSSDDVGAEEDEKRQARLIRNRESAQLSRQRKKHYVEELEDKVRIMHSTIQDLNAKISYIMAENANLKTQMGATGVPPQAQPPPAGMYPLHPHMMYPWMSYAPPYMVKPQGSQVPLVPIPKWRPKPAEPAPKSSKKVEKKKSEVKTKKVASISFLGLLFFMLLFGGLVPLLNVRYGGMREPFMSGIKSGVYEKHYGRVLAVDGHGNGTGYFNGKGYSSHCGQRGHHENDQLNTSKAADEFARTGNESDLLTASLYVPRNDKLVKIDGNLIIHSVLASEKAMASHESADKNNKETGLAVPGDLAPAIPGKHPHLYRIPTVVQRALGNGEKENAKSTTQQWFLEGVAGPLLSSGMCTEVFQFDVSSSPGAIVHATAATNLSTKENKNATRLKKVVRNRRILNGPSVSLSRPTHNISEEQNGRTEKQENFIGNKSASSMVVSVLVDPREVGDGADGDGMMGPKSLSRIFVVVLIDSVKYVTYSCMLPFKGSVSL